ncbi:hypothetical protein F4678DRAFT_413764 [Xylaria arbuscula]|nr:hypothetical protein F4678DRAFT_413764 [Xylaria arbuscula]
MPEDGKAQSSEITQPSAADLGAMTNERSLNTVYLQCIHSYQQFLIRCSQNNNPESNKGLEKCYEEYSRLKIWGYQRKAALELSAPDSLAATLADHADIANTILEIYEQIIRSFDRLAPLPPEVLGGSFEFLAIESDTDDDSETRSHMSDNSGHEDDSRIGFELLEGRYLYSAQYIAQPIAGQSYQEDFQHIRQKFLLWQKESYDEMIQEAATEAPKGTQSIKEEAEEIATPELTARESTEEMVLSHRLAVANMKRRKQFRYWDAHPYRIEPEQPQAVNVEPPPAANSVENSSSARVPDLPLPDDSKSLIECPYCHMTLSVDEMKSRVNWVRHVFRDVRPYVCTSLDCPDPDKLFTTRRDWIYHEMQLHRREWVCQPCACRYTSKSEMADHIRHVHNSNIEDRELALVLDMSERPIDESSSEMCPFCHRTMSTKKLMDHMAYHMENLALFSLPREYVGSTGTEEALSHIAGARQSDTRTITETPSVGYHSHLSADSGDHNQPASSTIVAEENKNTHLAGVSQSSPGITTETPSVGYSSDISSDIQKYTQRERTITQGFGGGGSKGGRVTVYYCHLCNQGPWNINNNFHCQNCGHKLCGTCPHESRLFVV